MISSGGKIISVSSVKGGVGKTTTVLNLAGIYYLLKKKVLIMDMDLFSGGISALLDLKNKKDIFMLVDSISNNRFTSLNDYIVNYNKNIDVIPSVKDPRLATRIDSKYIKAVFKLAKTLLKSMLSIFTLTPSFLPIALAKSTSEPTTVFLPSLIIWNSKGG